MLSFCTRKQNKAGTLFATLRVFNGTMRAPLRAADPLPIQSHPCPLFCLQPANNMYGHRRRPRPEIILTSSCSGAQKREGQVNGDLWIRVTPHTQGAAPARTDALRKNDFQNSSSPAYLTSVWPIRGRSRARIWSRDREK